MLPLFLSKSNGGEEPAVLPAQSVSGLSVRHGVLEDAQALALIAAPGWREAWEEHDLSAPALHDDFLSR
jgi:hypothetical protein